jgi:hypothetical protein
VVDALALLALLTLAEVDAVADDDADVDDMDEDPEALAEFEVTLAANWPDPTLIEVTGAVLLSLFWYQSIPQASAMDSTFQPFESIRGKLVSKTPMVLGLSSCSRMQRPGDLGPVIQPDIAALTLALVYAGSWVIAQSPESERISAAQVWSKQLTLVPDDGLEPKDTLCNGTYTVVNVPERWPPEFR